MRTVKFRIAALVALCCVAALLELHTLHRWPFAAPRSQANPDPVVRLNHALLPESETAAIPKAFLGNSKTEITSWEPTVAEMETMESNLNQISALTASGSEPNLHIDEPSQYFRQYVAFAHDSERQIFVNAFCKLQEGDRNQWRKHLNLAMDGGTCFWQALYNPSTQRFTNLQINGLG